ncbi:MAG: hypothetical protein QOJ20_3049 [Mycobacterium sp.]|jgi:hypothetical protein|nr:hypothetical protein [Mycobacterium sp.]
MKIAFRNPYGDGLTISAMQKEVRKKGRPPPGGEEAEVVVYQPRGVGLMHTRHKPSNAYYTHGTADGRKYCLQEKAPDSRKDCSHRHLS